MFEIIVVVGIVILIARFVYVKLKNDYRNLNRLKDLEPKLRNEIKAMALSMKAKDTLLESEKRTASNKISNLNSLLNQRDQRIEELESCVEKKDQLFKSIQNKTEESVSNISSLYSDFLLVQYSISETYLKTKKHPAHVEASRINELKKQTKSYIEQYRRMVYKYEALLQLFPELVSYVDDFETVQQLEDFNSIESLQDDFDRVQFYVSKEEYQNMSAHERNQLALDRYVSGRKTNWQIGRDYEQMCGWELELAGWDVEYIGMEKKLNDMGRDLIAMKKDEILIVQCKYWSLEKTIHEKHITQLYGTTVAYRINQEETDSRKVTAVFITNTTLSDTARKFAEILGVKLVNKPMKEFPRIKCNLNKDEFGLPTRIYHLPFDQQYDRTKIKDVGEYYAYTVEEAVKKGFRRAFRYYGS